MNRVIQAWHPRLRQEEFKTILSPIGSLRGAWTTYMSLSLYKKELLAIFNNRVYRMGSAGSLAVTKQKTH